MSSDCCRGTLGSHTFLSLWFTGLDSRLGSLLVHLAHGNPLLCPSLGQAVYPPLADMVKTEESREAWLPEHGLACFREERYPAHSIYPTACKKLSANRIDHMEARDLINLSAQHPFLQLPTSLSHSQGLASLKCTPTYVPMS